MGNYTELCFAAELKRDAPEEVLEVLRYLVGDRDRPPTPEHRLFLCERWHMLGVGDSAYFPADSHARLSTCEYDGTHNLTIRSNLKNYDGEIELFLDWISPYLGMFDGDFLGFYRYEETETPTLIYYPCLFGSNGQNNQEG